MEHWRKPHFSPYIATPPSEWRILDYGHYSLAKPDPHGGRTGIGPDGLFCNSAGQPYDPQPGVIWTVEEYQKQKDIYKKLERPYLPGLIAGSPACDSYLAEIHFKNVMGDAKTQAKQDRTAEFTKTGHDGLPEHTVRRIRELIAANHEEFNNLLRSKLSKAAQGLIDRGLYHSSMQITESHQVCDEGLHAQCQRAVETIQRVLSTHRIRFSDVLADELRSFFQDVYDTALMNVRQILDRAIPEQNKKLCDMEYKGIPVDKYFVELELLVDTLREDVATQAQQTICDTQLDTREETDPDIQRKFMEMAIDEARKCKPEDSRVHPRVGAVVVKGGVVLAKAHRGELVSGDHAEYTAMEKKLPDEVIAGATIYTTLEPCTTRNHPKVPCAHRLSERKVSRVVIGMLDPNPAICGKGLCKLRDANIGVDLFDNDLKAQIEEMNRDFIRYHKSAGTSTDEGERVSSSTTATVAAEPDPIECACRAACGCAAGVDELREVWNSQIDAPEEIVHFKGIAAAVLRLVYHLKRSKELFPPVATVVRAVRPEPPATLLGVPSGASYHDMAIAKAEQTLWCFSPDAHCGKEVLDLISSTALVVLPAELRRLFNDESSGSLRDRITKKLQEARRVPFLWDQLCKSMQRIEKFDAVALVAAIEHEAALAKGASGRQLPA